MNRIDQAYFHNLVSRTSFVPETSVLWFPEMILPGDDIEILYNSRSPHSRLTECDNIQLHFYRLGAFAPDKTCNMEKKEEGIFNCCLQAGSFAVPGFIVFTAPQGGMDNNSGSPWKLTVMERLPEFAVTETKHFIYYCLIEDSTTLTHLDEIVERLNSGMDKIIELTGLTFACKPRFFYYYTRDLLLKYQGNMGNNYEEFRNLVYSCEDPADLHEATHLLFQQLGRHVGFFDEGVAIHFGQQHKWRRRSCDSWAREFLGKNHLPDLKSILSAPSFYQRGQLDEVLATNYPVAGSFVGFLLKRCGLEKFKTLFSEINVENQKSAESTLAVFNKVYTQGLSFLETEWKEALVSR